jgi:hypothetical protein
MRTGCGSREFLFAVACASLAGAQPARVGVDPRVELMSVLFRLAGNNEYNQCRVPEYDKALERHFEPYKDHEAVRLAREFQLGFDAPMNLAVYVKDVQTLAERVPFDKPGIGLDARWHGAQARAFLAASRRFVKDARFAEFLERQRPLYTETDERLRKYVEKEADLEWLNRFFGRRAAARFYVVPGLANGGPSYGASIVAEDGVEEIYAIPGVWQVDGGGMPMFSGLWKQTLVHEFIHSYTNPLVDRFAGRMEKAARQINEPVQGAMRRQAYGTWKTLLYESMVRASTIEYVRAHDGAAAARRLVNDDNARSFFWVGALADLLGEYQKDRTSFPTLESFMPEVVKFFDGVAPRLAELMKRYEEARPRVVSISVADGARDVDPELRSIVVRFSRPMATDHELEDPRMLRPQFDAGGTVATMPVSLEPGRSYSFRVRWPDGQPFQSADGVSLQPLEVRFETRGKQ